jgi:hypothetical protein
MKQYTINYIDGHDLRFKTFKTVAEDRDQAIKQLRASYIDGDFDHQIESVIEEGEPDERSSN